MPTTKANNSKPMANRLVDRVMDKIDMDALTESLADKIGEKMLTCINVDSLVNALHEQHTEEFQQALTEAILSRL